MLHFDRRSLINTIVLTLGGFGYSRLLVAQSPSAPSARSGGARPARLSLNENPFGPAPSAIDAVRNELANVYRYTDTGFDELADLIVAREGVSRQQIVLGEILEPLGTHLSLHGGAGGEFIYSEPGYTALIDSATAVGGVAIGVPLNPQMQNDLSAISARLNQHTRAVFLVNPHNPTGLLSDADQLRSFARAASRQALIIVDEAYMEFAEHYARHTLVDLVRDGHNVIVFRTFAKAFGLAGLDIGYGLVPKPLAQALSARDLNNPHLFNRLAIAAAVASLKDTNYVMDVSMHVAREREKWFQLFRELNVKFTASSGNFVFFETGVAHAHFAATLLERGVDIGRAFPPYDRWARISIGLPEENVVARAAVRELLHKAIT
jgi:histidinol-phosphate aminotransferase